MRDLIGHIIFALGFMLIGAATVLILTSPVKTRKDCMLRGYEPVVCHMYFEE